MLLTTGRVKLTTKLEILASNFTPCISYTCSSYKFEHNIWQDQSDHFAYYKPYTISHYIYYIGFYLKQAIDVRKIVYCLKSNNFKI